jgi:DNA-binding transcriptional LysR family regulator
LENLGLDGRSTLVAGAQECRAIAQRLCKNAHMSAFDWDALKTFLAVARAGRLTVAAQRLSADHTTVSRRIAGLETALKASLFHRAPTGYRLTPQGERLLGIAEAMEGLSLTAQAEIGEADLAAAGTVRIGAPEGFGSYVLAPRLGQLADSHPALKVELVAIAGVFSLSKREADMAVQLSPPREGRLVARKLTDYRLGLYAAPSYLERAPPLEQRADLPRHRFIGYIEDLLSSPELDYLRQGDIPIDAQIKSSNLIAQLASARAGAGLCVLPHFIAAAEPGLVQVLAQAVRLERAFWLVIHEDLRGLARVRAVADFLIELTASQRGLFLGD